VRLSRLLVTDGPSDEPPYDVTVIRIDVVDVDILYTLCRNDTQQSTANSIPIPTYDRFSFAGLPSGVARKSGK